MELTTILPDVRITPTLNLNDFLIQPTLHLRDGIFFVPFVEFRLLTFGVSDTVSIPHIETNARNIPSD
jgi:hypothetical protein